MVNGIFYGIPSGQGEWELIDAGLLTSSGTTVEFAERRFGRDARPTARLPGFDADDLLDPTVQSTFEAAKLDWSRLIDPNSSEMLAFYWTLLALRHQRIMPLLHGLGGGGGSFRREGSVTADEWVLKDRARLLLIANLSEKPAQYQTSPSAKRIFSLGSSTDETLSPWLVIFSIQSTQLKSVSAESDVHG
ncbi:DUF3459 domain-containing protein [Rhizobium sp. XQZ8]|nr:DUF3459 domain-containing protein [Rhizobium populisoli]